MTYLGGGAKTRFGIEVIRPMNAGKLLNASVFGRESPLELPTLSCESL